MTSIYDFFYKLIRKLQFLSLKKKLSHAGNFKLFGLVTIEYAHNVSIGNNTTLNSGVYISGHDKVNIGNNVSLSAGCKLITAYLDKENIYNKDKVDIHKSKAIVIHDYVQIGAGAIILPGVTIEEGVIVGAGAVVTKNVKKDTIVAGVPAREIKK